MSKMRTFSLIGDLTSIKMFIRYSTSILRLLFILCPASFASMNPIEPRQGDSAIKIFDPLALFTDNVKIPYAPSHCQQPAFLAWEMRNEAMSFGEPEPLSC